MTGGTVVVLGITAATSPPACPVAWLCLRSDGDFNKRCNMAMVALDKVCRTPSR